MKEISRELWDDIKYYLTKCIKMHLTNVPLDWKEVEKMSMANGIKIIEPDYLARARELKEDGFHYRKRSNLPEAMNSYERAIENYEKHIKQLEEKDNGRE